jgi:hypothetical protein
MDFLRPNSAYSPSRHLAPVDASVIVSAGSSFAFQLLAVEEGQSLWPRQRSIELRLPAAFGASVPHLRLNQVDASRGRPPAPTRRPRRRAGGPNRTASPSWTTQPCSARRRQPTAVHRHSDGPTVVHLFPARGVRRAVTGTPRRRGRPSQHGRMNQTAPARSITASEPSAVLQRPGTPGELVRPLPPTGNGPAPPRKTGA